MPGERLILTGFMGTGKSTVGSKAAELSGIEYYDTDTYMESVCGIDIPELVKTDLPAFRKLEAKTLAVIIQQEPGIISTGGGIISTEVGRQALREANVPVVWLTAPFESAAERVSRDTGRERPLFSNIEKARALYQEREPWYEATATYTVDASRPVDLVVNDILRIAQADYFKT